MGSALAARIEALPDDQRRLVENLLDMLNSRPEEAAEAIRDLLEDLLEPTLGLSPMEIEELKLDRDRWVSGQIGDLTSHEEVQRRFGA